MSKDLIETKLEDMALIDPKAEKLLAQQAKMQEKINAKVDKKRDQKLTL